MAQGVESVQGRGPSFIEAILRFCMQNMLVVALLAIMAIGWGLRVAPFDWDLGSYSRDPIPVDAIPDIGENQQIVFTEWMGRSPQDIEDQVTYPLTVSLLGVPGVKTIRSFSMFGFSTIYVIFKDDIEFYWSRSRVLEKLSSLSPGTLPQGVQPVLGPDATALGQVFWYTLEGHDEAGNVTGGWDLHELRSIQDWTVRYALLAAEGVSEVASIGGFVQEYQIDVDPDSMRANRVTLDEVFRAVQASNVDVGARTIEVNAVEYVVRGVGFIKQISDLEDAVIKVNDNVPIYVKNVARVTLGPALRRGMLDKAGAEAVGGVVVVRYGDNPLAAIKNIKKKIAEIAPGLPKKILSDGTVSRVTVVPFYDRSGLIYETLGTLQTALTEEILITIIVVVMMVANLRTSILIAGLLPLAVLMCFIAMKIAGVDANIVALSGIAIAIGTMVDMGIIVCENILTRLDKAKPDEDKMEVILRATSEVGGAVLTAVATTVVSFLPVFAMEAAEGKLFKPLAYTKTFALIASIIVALVIIPPAAYILFGTRVPRGWIRPTLFGLLGLVGLGMAILLGWWWAGGMLIGLGLYGLVSPSLSKRVTLWLSRLGNVGTALLVAIVLSEHWLPLGADKGLIRNIFFVVLLIGGLLGFFHLFQRVYPRLLGWCLEHKTTFLMVPMIVLVLGGSIWIGFGRLFSWAPSVVLESDAGVFLASEFPGLGKEFMPPLDEGSYLYMPSTMPHASIGEVIDVIQKQDIAFSAIPEIDTVVGKLGRVDSPLDPAPLSMIETVINYKPQFLTDRSGRRLTFRFDADDSDLFRDVEGNPVPAIDGQPYTVRGRFERDGHNELVSDPRGRPFRLWRPALDPELNPGRQAWAGVVRPDNRFLAGPRPELPETIWDLIVLAGRIPGTTSAPMLQPISTRLVMLQSGMRAPMGIKIKGPTLESIEKVGLRMEQLLKEVPSINPAAVIADRIVGKPYLEIEIKRTAIARYGIKLAEVQKVIEVAIGGTRVTTTLEGRERYPVRVRYMRELRDSIEALDHILVPAPGGAQIPLTQLTTINYVRGPQAIKSEDTFLVGYVLFDMKPGHAEVDVVQDAQAYLQQKLASEELILPAGVSYRFAGTYENQLRSEQKLKVILPLALFVIFIILYLQFRSVLTTGLVFSGIAVAWAGGFIMLWLYAQPWFLNFSILGTNMRELFQVHPINLSVAVWVGFLALFGIASDDGVVMATYLKFTFAGSKKKSVDEVRAATIAAGCRRVRPCLMTTATTILALIPVLTSTGRGSDIMVPMAIPSFGGMLIAVMTMLVVPVLYCSIEEFRLRGRTLPDAADPAVENSARD